MRLGLLSRRAGVLLGCGLVAGMGLLLCGSSAEAAEREWP